MTICIVHVVESNRDPDECPDCIIDKLNEQKLFYVRHIKYLEQFLKEEDWDSALQACQNLIDVAKK